MAGTLMLDSDGDLLCGEYENAIETIVASLGAYTVAQSMGITVSLKKGSVWFNLSAGIDYDALFYSTDRSDTEMEPIRSTALRNAIKAIPGFNGFEETQNITFTRQGRTLVPNIPCVEIDCDNQITNTFVEAI